MTFEERFWNKVDHRGFDECWPWLAYKLNGYGRFNLGKRGKGIAYAHRVAFFLVHDRWPEPLCLHTCNNPACCNPAHLKEGTDADNADDRITSGGQARGERHGIYTKPECYPRGEQAYQAKLNDGRVEYIRSRYMARRVSQQHFADLFGVSRESVRNALRGRSWKHLLIPINPHRPFGRS